MRFTSFQTDGITCPTYSTKQMASQWSKTENTGESEVDVFSPIQLQYKDPPKINPRVFVGMGVFKNRT